MKGNSHHKYHPRKKAGKDFESYFFLAVSSWLTLLVIRGYSTAPPPHPLTAKFGSKQHQSTSSYLWRLTAVPRELGSPTKHVKSGSKQHHSTSRYVWRLTAGTQGAGLCTQGPAGRGSPGQVAPGTQGARRRVAPQVRS
jgi:hypothetical protein